MRRLTLLLRALPFLGAVSGAAAAADDVTVFRVADEGSLKISAARATRGAGPTATVVVVLEGARGGRLVLRRSPREGGGTVYQAWLGGPPGVTFTRNDDAVLVEAGGRSFTVVEAELRRPTVACWVAALVASVEPKLLEAASGLRLLKELTGDAGRDDVYTPMDLLWQVADPSDLRPRGTVRVEKGPFAGPDWDRLRAAAAGELGKR